MPISRIPVDLDFRSYPNEIRKEIALGHTLEAFWLTNGYVNQTLIDWLYIIGDFPKKEISKRMMDEIDETKFHSLVLFHRILGNIDEPLYQKLMEFNRDRNKLGHMFQKTDYRKKLPKSVVNGAKCLEELLVLYKKALDAKKI